MLLKFILKDIKLPLRNSNYLFLSLIQNILLLAVFSLTLPQESLRISAEVVFWIVIFVNANLVVSKLLEQEFEEEAFHSLMFSGMHPFGVFLSKILSSTLYLTLLAFMNYLFLFVLFRLESFIHATLLIFLPFGSFGLANISVLVNLLVHRARFKGVVFNVIALPLYVPLLTLCIGMAQEFKWDWIFLYIILICIYMLLIVMFVEREY